jgi:glyoxylase-like metal-dependent hydrolase (beta-lactamase superfamily II)
MTVLLSFNAFTDCARFPSSWRTGKLCLLVETNQGPLLIDTGPGLEDYARPPAILRVFQAITRVAMDPQEAAIRQVVRLGYRPEDIRHILLTHMHFDHSGGLPDFPWAKVHVHQRELDAYRGMPRHLTNLAYVRRHMAHQPAVATYRVTGEFWLGLPAIRLPFEPEIWLVPLHGHTSGHCGVAVRLETGWHFHVGDAGPIGLQDYAPKWLVRTVLGPHTPRLQAFAASHPEVIITTGHMWLESFVQPAG